MTNWKYNLNVSGIKLRETIRSGDETVQSCINTLNSLLNCLHELKKKLTKEDYDWYFSCIEYSVQEYVAEFHEELDSELEDSMGGFYFYAEYCVNECLDDFYNACDTLRIWVGL